MKDNSENAISVLASQIYKVALRAVAKAGYDKTYPARIKRVINSSSGKYEIELLGELYIVYNNNDMVYAVNEAVWVTVPQNNFNNKYISGRRR